MLKVQDIFWVLYDSYNLVVIQNADLAAVNLEASACISPKDYPVLFLAPRSFGKFLGILVG